MCAGKCSLSDTYPWYWTYNNYSQTVLTCHFGGKNIIVMYPNLLNWDLDVLVSESTCYCLLFRVTVTFFI